MFKFFGTIIIKFNNFMLSRMKKGTAAGEMLILLPRCMQNTECRENIVDNFMNCKQCGKCPIANIKPLAQKYGIPACVATGSAMARNAVKEHKPRLIFAIACERELVQGIITVFPRPVCAIPNQRPNGPCRNTQVQISDVENAIKMYLKM